MSNAWDDRRKAKEEEYFQKKNREALERIKAKKDQKPRLSPITGEPMEQVVLHGVVIDRCTTSGGVWLDAGELEELIRASKAEEAGEGGLVAFVKSIAGLK